MLGDTIVALASAPGAGGRAVIRLSGPAAIDLAQARFRGPVGPGQAGRGLYHGWLRVTGVAAALPADLHVWPAPASYTGQDIAELHALSCPPLIERLIADLLKDGGRAARPGEFTLRAFLGGKLDLTRAEAVLDVIEAGSRDQLREALEQLAGGIQAPVQQLRRDLLDLLADLEAGLDFQEEDIQILTRDALQSRLSGVVNRLSQLERQLEVE